MSWTASNRAPIALAGFRRLSSFLGDVRVSAVPSSQSNPVPPAVDTWWSDAGMFLVHTALVYMGSISWFPWFVYRWFDVAPFLNIHPVVQRIDWYLQHLAAVNIGFALLVGYSMARAAKPATIWAWAVPLLVLTFQILLFKTRTSGSVFGGYRPP